MDVRSVWFATDEAEAEAACEELRAHGITCEAGEPSTAVVVAPEDEVRANDVLDAWAAGRWRS
jgi:hypothetical protein